MICLFIFFYFRIIGILFLIVGVIDSDDNLYIKTACLDSDISCYGLFKFGSGFPSDKQKYSKIFYYINLKAISKSDLSKIISNLISILIIYFSQFYITLFNKILLFNCNKTQYGKCLVNIILQSKMNLMILMKL